MSDGMGSLSLSSVVDTRLGLWYVMLRHGTAALALTDALATRFREVLPADQYEVSTGGLAVTVQRLDVRSFTVGTPVLMLATPGSREEKLRRVLEMAAKMVQQYIAPEAAARVRVTTDALTIWWGGPSEKEAIVRLRPIARHEARM